jgi:uncharacterized membrane protein (UPF0127 family)
MGNRGAAGFGSGLSLVLVLVLAGGAAAAASCREDQADLRAPGGNLARFTVEIADDPQEMARGLMFRDSLPRSAGMLFLYPAPRRVSFWMENTLIPLDMVFLDASGTVTRVHANAVPLDRTAIDGGAGVQAVLEINGGLAAALGIVPGSVLRHPGLPQAVAAWPCEG